LDSYGLDCSCSLGLPPEVHLPSNPEGARRFLDLAVETTAALGSPMLTGCLYTHVGTLTGKPPEPSELETVAHILKRRPVALRSMTSSLASRPSIATRHILSTLPCRPASCWIG
jgi:sugar phosphate isomerase/epimerase